MLRRVFVTVSNLEGLTNVGMRFMYVMHITEMTQPFTKRIYKVFVRLRFVLSMFEKYTATSKPA